MVIILRGAQFIEQHLNVDGQLKWIKIKLKKNMDTNMHLILTLEVILVKHVACFLHYKNMFQRIVISVFMKHNYHKLYDVNGVCTFLNESK